MITCDMLSKLVRPLLGGGPPGAVSVRPRRRMSLVLLLPLLFFRSFACSLISFFYQVVIRLITIDLAFF